MANEKELTELYSGPGAESFRVFGDENGRMRSTMSPGEIVTAAPLGAGMAIQDGGKSHSTVPRRSKSSMRTTRQQQNSRWGQHDAQLLDLRSPQARES